MPSSHCAHPLISSGGVSPSGRLAANWLDSVGAAAATSSTWGLARQQSDYDRTLEEGDPVAFPFGFGLDYLQARGMHRVPCAMRNVPRAEWDRCLVASLILTAFCAASTPTAGPAWHPNAVPEQHLRDRRGHALGCHPQQRGYGGGLRRTGLLPPGPTLWQRFSSFPPPPPPPPPRRVAGSASAVLQWLARSTL